MSLQTDTIAKAQRTQDGSNTTRTNENEEVPKEHSRLNIDDLVVPANLSGKPEIIILQYLDLIEQYETTLARIGKLFAEGYIDLAQANYGSGRPRFGQDYYHGNMSAAIIVEEDEEAVKLDSNGSTICSFSILSLKSTVTAMKEDQLEKTVVDLADPTMDKLSSKLEEVEVTSETLTKNSKKEASQLSTNIVEGALESEEVNKEVRHRSKVPLSMDPLRWFGVLVPQALRRSQEKFESGLESLILLRNLTFQIREMEKVIQALPK
ncbi:uncharacterized protein V1516DRAFT_666902 [Lipomyces oligophaga]|uniref:uncharacterized protein n=1 Tax=Lipomyces oligophaga TaxID=45792 RepID=UPI0034CD8DBC